MPESPTDLSTLKGAFKRESRPLIVEMVSRGLSLFDVREELLKRYTLHQKTVESWICVVVNDLTRVTLQTVELDVYRAIAIAQLTEIYKKAVAENDFKSALAATKQKCDLLGLTHSVVKERGPVGNRGKSPSVDRENNNLSELTDAQLRKALPDDVIDVDYTPLMTNADVEQLLMDEDDE